MGKPAGRMVFCSDAPTAWREMTAVLAIKPDRLVSLLVQLELGWSLACLDTAYEPGRI